MTSIYEPQEVRGFSPDSAQRKECLNELFRRLYQADDTENNATVTKKQCALDIAKELENNMLEKGQPEFIKTICTYMCRTFDQDKRHNLSSWVLKVLPDKYIDSVEESSMRSADKSVVLPEECSIRTATALEQLRSMKTLRPKDVGPSNSQKLYEEGCKVIHEWAEQMDHAHIAHFNPFDPNSETDEINESADEEYEETISAPSLPIPLDERIRQIDEEACKALKQLSKYLSQYADLQVRDPEHPEHDKGKSPSQTIEEAIEFRDAVVAELLLWRNYVDGKARRSMLQWAEINKNMAEHGGTAASSKSAQPVLDINTGQQAVDPKTGKLQFRGITKEQIDARGPKYASEMHFIIHAQRLLDVVEGRFQRWTSRLRDIRAKDANEKLSRQA